MASEKNLKTRLRRNLAAMLAVLLILYAGVLAISRTESVRAMVADKLSNGTGLPVSLHKCAMTPELGFHLEGLVVQDVEIPDAKLSFDWLFFLSKDRPFVKRIVLRDAVVRFRRIPASGKWEPQVLNGIGRRLGAVVGLDPVKMEDDASTPRFPPYAINGKTLLCVRNAKLAWLDEKGAELAAIKDADFNAKAGRFIDRKVVQTITKCGRIRLASGRELVGFRMEAFRVEGSALTTVLEMSDEQGEYPEFATPTLWQDLNLQLNRLSTVR